MYPVNCGVIPSESEVEKGATLCDPAGSVHCEELANPWVALGALVVLAREAAASHDVVGLVSQIAKLIVSIPDGGHSDSHLFCSSKNNY
jgi:hypothetical protein